MFRILEGTLAAHPSDVGQKIVPEKLLTLRAAAQALGIPAYKVRRAARRGLFPTYKLLNDRKLIRLSELIAAIERTREGGVL